MNYRSIISPLNKTNKIYVEPHKLNLSYRKVYNVFGDNDLDFTLQLLSKKVMAEAVIYSQNNLYYNFWQTMKDVGVDEFCEFFISQLPAYVDMPHQVLLNEMAQLGTSSSLVSFFLLATASEDGTPFGVPKSLTKERLALSAIQLKKTKKFMERLSFQETTDESGIYLCLNEIQRNFSNRDRDTLSFRIEDLPSTENNLVLSNLEFKNSVEKLDKFQNKFYTNA